MEKENFLYSSEYFEKIIKGLNLTKTLLISSIIIGEEHTGKKTLARMLFPEATFINAKTTEDIQKVIDKNSHIIICNFEYIKNIDNLNFENKNILALANKSPSTKKLEQIFAFIYHIPPLRDRDEDLKIMIEHFKNLAFKELMLSEEEINSLNIDEDKLDLSKNNRSLKASIFKQIIYSNINKSDLKNILYDYFLKNLSGDNEYAKNIEIFEVPLIEAGLKKFKSQLKLSSILGINRNTLRKKIDEHNIK